ncbi:MAG: hypothetical protein NVS3B5_10160 [Sphingomicrobium sp.]
MIAALATCTFLIAGWAALYSMVVDADDSGLKVIAAFKGQSFASRQPAALRPVTVRFSSRAAPRSQPVRAKAEWRAAA